MFCKFFVKIVFWLVLFACPQLDRDIDKISNVLSCSGELFFPSFGDLFPPTPCHTLLKSFMQ